MTDSAPIHEIRVHAKPEGVLVEYYYGEGGHFGCRIPSMQAEQMGLALLQASGSKERRLPTVKGSMARLLDWLKNQWM